MRDLGVKLPRTLFATVLMGTWIAAFASLGALFNLTALPAAALSVPIFYALFSLRTKFQSKSPTARILSSRAMLSSVG